MNIKYPFMVEFTGTPEAGKTTCIKEVVRRLKEQGFKVGFIRESAEILPSFIPKSSFDAHLYMRLQTIISIITNKYSNYDIVLIDRGIIDGIIFTQKFSVDNPNNIKECNSLILLLDTLRDVLLPNMLIVFSCSPQASIKRRGGEGRIVTLDFVKSYNTLLESFHAEPPTSQYNLNTTNRSKEQVASQVIKVIKNEYTKARN